MIRKATEFDSEVVHNFCEGNGDVVLKYAFHDSDMKSNCCACCTVTLEKGCSVGMHQHTADDEIYYIISGSGVVDEGDGVKVPVSAGDAILTGDNGYHSIANENDEPLVFLAVVINY